MRARQVIQACVLLYCALSLVQSAVATDDPCAQYTACGGCERATNNNCGWCGTQSAGSCMSGDATGPSYLNSTCTSNNWNFQTCPGDVSCAAATSCSSCNLKSQCLWCQDGGGSCLYGSSEPTNGQTCSQVVTYQQLCPNSSPSSSSSSLPLAGTLAIVFLSCFLILAVIRASAYCCCRCGKPKLGSATLPQSTVAGNDDIATTTRSRRRFMAFLALLILSIIFKIVSLAVNIWDKASKSMNGMTIKVTWGVLSEHTSIGSDSHITTYADLCDTYQKLVDALPHDNELNHLLTMCETQLVAGVSTLVTGSLSLLFTVLCAVFATIVLVGPEARRHRFAHAMWRLSGLAVTFSFTAMIIWGCSDHMVIHHQNGEAELAASWSLMQVAFILDLFSLALINRVIKATPDPNPQMSGMAYMAMPVEGQARLAPPMQQHGGHYPMAPVGYGQPMQQQQVPQPYYGQPMQQQQPLQPFVPQGQAYPMIYSQQM